MKRATILVFLALLLLAPLARAQDFIIHTDKTANTINPFIYGHFFEHIYQGGDNGLWGEMVWNRSFEYLGDDAGQWSFKGAGADRVLAQTAITEGAKLFFGPENLDNFDLTLQARKTGGGEGFLILFGGNKEGWFWANIAGWNNTGHQFQHVANNYDLGQRVPGRVETNRWYAVRLRREDRHLETFLDGTKILDFTISAGIPLSGQLGVGAWNTTTEYKDLKVTDLQGKVLYEGFPDYAVMAKGPGRHWEAKLLEVQLVTQDAFNDEHALHVKTAGAGAIPGFLEQKHFCFRKGETYKGSLFMKGKAGRTLTGDPSVSVSYYSPFKMMQPNFKMNTIKLPAPTNEWKEYPFEFTPVEDELDATLRIDFTPSSDLLLDQVSLMSDASIKNDGFRPDIYQAFAELQPTIIRWPGGCYAEQYHWKNAIGPQSKRKKNITPMWNDYDPNALGTDEYITLCRKTGAEPLLVINTGMHVTGTRNAAEWQPWIQEACDWVEYCNGATDTRWGGERANNGHPQPYRVKYWEIDNELWRSLQTSPAVYAQAIPLFAAAMKKVDPSITIIAHGGNGADRRYDRILLNTTAPNFDILSIHHYMDPQRFAAGIAEQDSLYHDLIAAIQASQNPNVKLYVSEWNAQTTDWRTGLYAAGLLNTFEKYGENLTMAGPALLFRHTSAPAWDNAFINFDQSGWFPAPNYVVMKLWRKNFAPNRLAVDGSTEHAASTAPTASGLNLIAARSADAKTIYLKVVNPTNADIPVHATLTPAEDFIPKTATFDLLAPGNLRARNTMEKPDTIKPLPAAVTLQNQTLTFTLPPCSAGVLTVTRSK